MAGKMIRLALWFMVLGLWPYATSAAPLPRTIIALYNPDQYDDWKERNLAATRIHTLAEMPLNHLGLVLEYHNVNTALPDITQRKDVCGVLTWFETGARINNPLAYLQWAESVVDSGKKFVILGDPGFLENTQGQSTSQDAINHFFQKLGLRMDGNWLDVTYDIGLVHANPHMTGFERKYEGMMAPYHPMHIIRNDVTSYATIRKGDNPATEGHVVITSPQGGYVAGGYEFFDFHSGDMFKVRQWYINPFRFFATAFATGSLPKPDTTTLAGRRIYYSHIDGDGWNNVTYLEEYRGKDMLSSEIIMEQAIKAFPELPVTVAPIAADIDLAWAGSEKSRNVARELFALPQVEVASHTYTHPFSWEFFEDGNPEKEIPYLKKYPGKVWDASQKNSLLSRIMPTRGQAAHYGDHLHSDYSVPRAFADKPFDIRLEIEGAAETINALAPEGKGVTLVQWSGDTLPFEKAVALTEKAGLRNMNGGDSRFDDEYPSVAWVAPLGRKIGNYWQVYASNSNENTYTHLWNDRFHGFKYLLKTVQNTGSPLRLKPFNIYYHMYSGEKTASLSALLHTLRYARSQEIAPITASRFAGIADGFYHTDIIPLGPQQWKIENRGALQTIRFDNARGLSVDFARSSGVTGQRHHQGSLYVYLDAEKPSILLAVHPRNGEAATPYLIQSRWEVKGMERSNGNFRFTCQGFGKGEMEWYVPANGAYDIQTGGKTSQRVIAKNHRLRFTLEDNRAEPQQIHIKYRGNV